MPETPSARVLSGIGFGGWRTSFPISLSNYIDLLNETLIIFGHSRSALHLWFCIHYVWQEVYPYAFCVRPSGQIYLSEYDIFSRSEHVYAPGTPRNA